MDGEFIFLFWGLAVEVGVLLPLSPEVYEPIPHFIIRMVIRRTIPGFPAQSPHPFFLVVLS